jgi:guanine nucleotide-binding protein G(i) subunit alpha
MRSFGEQKKISQLIDRQLEEDSRRLRRTANILLLGDDDCGQDIVKTMKIVHMNGFTTEERSGYKILVRNTLWDILRSMELVVEQTDVELDEITKIYAQTLSRELKNRPDGDVNISDVTVEAAQRLWASEQAEKLFNPTEVYLPYSTP